MFNLMLVTLTELLSLMGTTNTYTDSSVKFSVSYTDCIRWSFVWFIDSDNEFSIKTCPFDNTVYVSDSK